MYAVLKWYRDHKEETGLFVAVFLGAAFILHWVFRLSLATSAAIGAPLALAFVVTFHRLLSRYHEKQNTPLLIEDHPGLGQVRIFPDRWEATVAAPPFDGEVEVSGDSEASPPTSAQIALFQQIRERYHSLLQMAFTALSDDFQTLKPPLQSRDLKLSSICLDSAAPSSFSLTFDVPSRPTEVALGLYADFVDFQVEDAGWVH